MTKKAALPATATCGRLSIGHDGTFQVTYEKDDLGPIDAYDRTMMMGPYAVIENADKSAQFSLAEISGIDIAFADEYIAGKAEERDDAIAADPVWGWEQTEEAAYAKERIVLNGRRAVTSTVERGTSNIVSYYVEASNNVVCYVSCAYTAEQHESNPSLYDDMLASITVS